MPATISLPELLWTIVSFIGACYRAGAVRDALKDRASAELFNGMRDVMQTVSGASLRSELVGLAVKIGFVAIGIAAMTQPQNPAAGTALYQTLTAAILIGSVILIDIHLALSSRDRARVRRALLRHED